MIQASVERVECTLSTDRIWLRLRNPICEVTERNKHAHISSWGDQLILLLYTAIRNSCLTCWLGRCLTVFSILWFISWIFAMSGRSTPSTQSSDDLDDFPGRLIHQVFNTLMVFSCLFAVGLSYFICLFLFVTVASLVFNWIIGFNQLVDEWLVFFYKNC